MNKIIILIGLTSVLICSGCVDYVTPPCTENITFEIIAQRDWCRYQYGMDDVMGDDPMALIITDIGEWNKFNDKYMEYRPTAPDFENYLAIAVFRGNKPASGYDIHIENITRSQNMMTVMVNMSEHMPRHCYAAEVTSPYCIATVKKTDMIEQKENIKFVFYNDKKQLILSYDNGSYVLPKSLSQNEEKVDVENESQISHTEKYGKLDNGSTRTDVFEDIALQHIAQTHNIPIEQLGVTARTEAHYRMIDKRLWCMKISDHESDEMYAVSIDMDGNIVDETAIKDEERKAYVEKYGKLEPALYDRLQGASGGELIKVGIWLTPIDSERIEKEVLSKIDEDKRTDENAARSEIFAAKKEAYSLKEKPVIDYLNAKGFEIISASFSAPLIFAELPGEEIIALEERDDVVRISLSKICEPETSEPMILPKGTSIPFVNIAQDFFYSGYKEKTQKFFVVTNQTELGALPSLGRKVDINLSDYFMIVAFHGHRDAGGSRIDIVNITQSDDEIRVMIGASELGGAPVDAEVSPYQVVAVEKSDLTKKSKIKFVFFDVSGRKLDEIEKSIFIVDHATPPGTENIPFVTIGRGTGFGGGMGDDPMALTITDAGEWNKLNSIYRIPTLDFENYLAIAVFQGAKPTPGYRIHVENITRSHNTITVMVNMSEHLSGYSCAEMVTHPYCVIAVKKTEMAKRKENIKFIFYTEKNN